jgi:CheY-like chemotaxis protein
MKVLTATSGKEALDRYREGRPGVVVVDLAMPEMDGFETLTQLQSLGKSAYIALAVRGDTALHERARKAGYQNVIEKPFQSEELAGKVMAAAVRKITPDDLVGRMLSEENGCSVLVLPASQSHVLGRIIPAIARRLKGLAESGADKLILDLGDAAQATTELVSVLAAVIREAMNLGIRVAVCTSNEKLIAHLRQSGDTRHAPCSQNREAARASLQ